MYICLESVARGRRPRRRPRRRGRSRGARGASGAAAPAYLSNQSINHSINLSIYISLSAHIYIYIYIYRRVTVWPQWPYDEKAVAKPVGDPSFRWPPGAPEKPPPRIYIDKYIYIYKY